MDYDRVSSEPADTMEKCAAVSEVLGVFENTYLNKQAPINVEEAHFVQKNGIKAVVTFTDHDKLKSAASEGNGRLDAVANAIREETGLKFRLDHYSEHSLDQKGTGSVACSYVGLIWEDKTVTWGAGTDTDIINAGIKALVSAINNKK